MGKGDPAACRWMHVKYRGRLMGPSCQPDPLQNSLSVTVGAKDSAADQHGWTWEAVVLLLVLHHRRHNVSWLAPGKTSARHVHDRSQVRRRSASDVNQIVWMWVFGCLLRRIGGVCLQVCLFFNSASRIQILSSLLCGYAFMYVWGGIEHWITQWCVAQAIR